MLFKKIIRYLIFILCVVPSFVEGAASAGGNEIVLVKDLDRLEREIDSLDENALVVFDIDFTLLINLSRPYHKKSVSRMWNGIFSGMMSGVEPQKVVDLLSIMHLSSDYGLVDDGFIDLIKKIKEKGCKALALTDALPQKYGRIGSVAEMRVKNLKDLGIDFEKFFSGGFPMVFDEVSDGKLIPLFLDGILFAARCGKGKVLATFLDRMNLHSSKVIFIDDSWCYLKSVEAAMEEKRIGFLGLHYRAIDGIPCFVDEVVARFQIDTLIKEERWIGYDKAAKLYYESVGSQEY